MAAATAVSCSAGASCGWSYAGPNLVPCAADGAMLPMNGEGTNMAPQKGRLPGCGDVCEGIIPLEECRAACETTAGCDAVAWNPKEGCYLKTNTEACATTQSGKMCPWNADRGNWEYHVHCACSLPGTFASGSPKVVCGAEWGWALIIALACVSAAYVGGALAYSQKVHGAAALPHPVFWHEVRALVEDGLSYTKARALGGGGGGGGSAEGSGGGAAYTAVPEVASASTAAAAAATGGSSDSDGDELVE